MPRKKASHKKPRKRVIHKVTHHISGLGRVKLPKKPKKPKVKASITAWERYYSRYKDWQNKVHAKHSAHKHKHSLISGAKHH
jgi:hypothetical protein